MSSVTGGSSGNRSSRPFEGTRFDLSDEHSTLQLLRSIHTSTLNTEIKNKLRDLVFAFRAENGAVVTKELADLFAEHGFSLVIEGVSETSEEDEGRTSASSTVTVTEAGNKEQKKFGFSRRVPQFGPALSSVAKETASDTHTGVDQGFAPHVAAMQQTEAVQTKPKTGDTGSSSTTSAVSADTEKGSQSSSAAPADTSSSPQAEETQAVNSAPTDVMDRIREIKRQVNTLVGNPVNLIDVHNELGREYMNALLDAMKKSNGGSEQEVSDAMQRLEKAFQDVQRMLTDPTVSVDGTVHNDTAATIAPEASESGIPKTDTEDSAAHVKEGTQTQKDVSTNSQKVSDTADTREPIKNTQTEGDVPEDSDVKKDNNTEEVQVPSDMKSQYKTDTATPDMATSTSLSSVAKAKQVEQMRLAQKAKEANIRKKQQETQLGQTDPLMTPEVNAGLKQLLSDWDLFKRSGLFGTGPNGIDHPLYKRLAPLTMAAVVAGRFEGVTPQIKRNIAGCMNGWRYAEGIVHEHGETFEHYLRRVVKHILDKRQKKA